MKGILIVVNIAFIPVRGGSASIPLKNIMPIAGAPLIYWATKAVCTCSEIDVVYISTDSDEIKTIVESFKTGAESELFSKVQVISRSEESATNTAPTIISMLEFARQYQFDTMVLLQATSPMVSVKDIDGALALFNTPDTDSVLSVVRQHRFLWQTTKDGFAKPQNYDPSARPRRQDFDGCLIENGSIYIVGRENLLKHKNFLVGNIRAYEMNADTAFEIDEPSDWLIVEALMQKNGFAKGRD